MEGEKFYKVTCGVYHDRSFMLGFVTKIKGEDEDLVHCGSEGAWELYCEDGHVDYYDDYVSTSSSYAFLVKEEISESEYNDSDNWKEPTGKEIRLMA